MHMKKFISTGLCLMLLVCSLAPMAACENNVSGLPHDDQAEIEELQKQLEEQQHRIDTLEKENEAFRQQFADIELQRNAPYGIFCSLEVAYDLGYLTRENLMSIAEIQNQWTQSDNENAPSQQAELLDETIAREIRETAAYAIRTDSSPVPQADYEDVFINDFYGCYNGVYTVMVTDAFSGYDTAAHDINIGGVTFHYRDGRRISVYLDNDDYRSVIPQNLKEINVWSQMTAESSSAQSETPSATYLGTSEEWQAFLQEHPTTETFLQDYNDEYFAQKSLLACQFSAPATDGTIVYSHVYSLWGIWHVFLAYDSGAVSTSESKTIFVLYEIQKNTISEPPQKVQIKTEII